MVCPNPTTRGILEQGKFRCRHTQKKEVMQSAKIGVKSHFVNKHQNLGGSNEGSPSLSHQV